MRAVSSLSCQPSADGTDGGYILPQIDSDLKSLRDDLGRHRSAASRNPSATNTVPATTEIARAAFR